MQSTIFILSGQSILTNVQMMTTRISIEKYSMIIKNLYSGFTLIWITHLILKVFCTSLRLTQNMNPSKVLLNFITIRYSLQITLKKLFQNSYYFLKVLLTAQTFHLMYPVLHSRMMDLLRKYLIISLKRLPTSFLACARQIKKTMRNTGMISIHLSNSVA